MTSKIRVAHVVFAGQRGGAERMLIDLAGHETSAEHVVVLMTPSELVHRMFVDAGLTVFAREGVRESPLSYLRMSLGRGAVEHVRRLLVETHADIAQLHTFQSHVVGTRAALLAGARVLRTEHDTRHFFDPSTAVFTRWALRRADKLVAISDHVADVVGRTAPYVRERITVVRNGVDTEYFSPRALARDGVFRAVVACRLEPGKQVDVVIEAIARAPGVHLDVVGEGAMRAKLEDLARRIGVTDRVHFHGYVADVRDLIARADIAVSGSRHESLGLSVLESLSMGKPVVAFAVGGIPESVRDGETGWLVHTQTADALASAIREAAADHDRLLAIGESARSLTVRDFGIEAMCRGYAKVYRELMGETNTSA